MTRIRFEWDEAKNLANRRKHGVSFEEASRVFLDPFYFSLYERIEDGEERWQTFGLVGGLLLMAAHTVGEEGGAGPLEVIRIITAREATARERDDDMKTKMVSYTFDTLPPLTAAQLANLSALAARPDSEIDTSDAPELTDEQWKHAKRGHFYRPLKRQITARVDADVLDWLKAQGNGYQSRINAILRREMLESVKSAEAK